MRIPTKGQRKSVAARRHQQAASLVILRPTAAQQPSLNDAPNAEQLGRWPTSPESQLSGIAVVARIVIEEFEAPGHAERK
jgi:hypothetical protein